MLEHTLWKQIEDWKKNCKWVELTRNLDADTAHWSGFSPMEIEVPFTHDDGFFVHKFTTVTQYGTHVDAPIHFVRDTRCLDEIMPEEMVCPLCVIDGTDKVKENCDYALTADDVREWEKVHGPVPEGAFVAFRSDWSKRPDDTLDNVDENGMKHYPGWSVEAIDYLVKERNICAIGHETSDTDPAVIAQNEGFLAEIRILEYERYQIEMLINLDQVPATGALIFCSFPKATGFPGFPARCFAVCPK